MAMAKMLHVWSCLLVAVAGVAPPAVIPSPVSVPVAGVAAPVASQKPGNVNVGMVAAPAANTASNTQFAPRLRGEPSVVPAPTAWSTGVGENALMETLKSTPPTGNDKLREASVSQFGHQDVSDADTATSWMGSLGSLALAAVAGAAVAGAWHRRRVQAVVSKQSATEMTVSNSMVWPEQSRFAVAAVASEAPFDPVGMKKQAGKPKSSDAEIKHGRQAFLEALRPQAMKAALRRGGAALIPATAAAVAASPAYADAIGDAAKKLATEAYPFMQEVNWNSTAYLVKPGTASAADWAKAVDKAIVMGAAMDSKLLKAGVMAHHKAIGATSEANPVLSKGDFESVTAAIGRMIASVPESTTMDVYNAFSALVSKDVPPYLMSTVKEADAMKAYNALLEFKDVVKANPITPTPVQTPAALSGKLGAIDAAAGKLSAAAYPLVQSVDWTSDLALKPLPGASANAVLKAIDKALVMGASMDGKLLQDAAQAHHKAIGGMDAKLVASLSDFEGINAALGKVIASVPTSQVMDVYNFFGKIVSPVVPNYLYSSVNPADATAAYLALLKFKDVVKAAQV